MFEPQQILLQPYWENREAYYRFVGDRGFGVELVSFAFPAVLNHPDVVEQHRDAYQAELAAFSGAKTMHGPFIDITPHSPDRLIAEASMQRITSCLEIAEQLEVSHVIFHTGINCQIRNEGYFDRAAGLQAEAWQSALERFPRVTICLENMWEPDATVFQRILERTNDPRLKVCFDVGHAHVFSTQAPEAWLDTLAEDVVYLHLNDNHGDSDSELPLGRGNIDWTRFFRAVRQLPTAPFAVLEVNALDAVTESLKLLVQEGMLQPQGSPEA